MYKNIVRKLQENLKTLFDFIKIITNMFTLYQRNNLVSIFGHLTLTSHFIMNKDIKEFIKDSAEVLNSLYLLKISSDDEINAFFPKDQISSY